MLIRALVVGLLTLTGCASHPTRSPRPAIVNSCESGTAADMLLSAGVIPLCKSPRPSGSDFTLRYTSFVFSSHGTYTYRARRGRLFIEIADEAYDPPVRYNAESKLSPARFYRLLTESGLDTLWRADDPDCDPHIKVIVEVGSVIEFQDASGYHVRHGPRAQANGCATPYATAFREVKSVVDELDAVPTRR